MLSTLGNVCGKWKVICSNHILTFAIKTLFVIIWFYVLYNKMWLGLESDCFGECERLLLKKIGNNNMKKYTVENNKLRAV